MRAVEAQDVAQLHGRENLVGEHAARHVADVQLEEGIVMRRVGQREAAPPAVLEQDVDILPGEELQAFGGGQAEVHFDDVRRQAFELLDPRRQGLDRDVGARGQLLAFERQVRLWPGTAE